MIGLLPAILPCFPPGVKGFPGFKVEEIIKEAPTALVSRGRKAAFLDNQANQSVGTLVDNPGQRTPEFAPDILRHPGELGV